MKKRRKRQRRPGNHSNQYGYGRNYAQGVNSHAATVDSSINYNTSTTENATSNFGNSQNNIHNIHNTQTIEPAANATPIHTQPPNNVTSSSHPDPRYRDNNIFSRILNAVDHVVPDDEDIAVTAIKKDGIHAPRAAINAKRTSKQMAQRRTQQRLKDGSDKQDGFIRKNLDRTYVATQFTDNVMPNERPNDNEGVMAVRDGLHSVAKVVEVFATSERKPKKRRLIEEETKLRHDDVSDLENAGKLQHDEDTEDADGKLRHGEESEGGELKHEDGASESPGNNVDNSSKDSNKSPLDSKTAGAAGGTDSGAKEHKNEKPPPNADNKSEAKPKTIDIEGNPSPVNSSRGSQSSDNPTQGSQLHSDKNSEYDTSPLTSATAPTGSGSPSPPVGNMGAVDAVGSDAGQDCPILTKGQKKRQSKLGEKVGKLEKKGGELQKKLQKTEQKLPTQKVKKTKLIHDPQKGTTDKLKFTDKEKLSIGEAKWNRGPSKTLSANVLREGGYATSNKFHQKISQVENLDGNTGLRATHDGQRFIGRNLRRGKDLHRYVKNRHYRRYSKLQAKSLKNKGKLEYMKLLRDNPDIRRNPLSRMMQKRRIKRAYAAQIRAAKTGRAFAGASSTVAAVGKMAKIKAYAVATAKAKLLALNNATAILLKLGIFLVINILILSLFTMCGMLFTGIGGVMSIAAFPSDEFSISEASVLYTELETNLKQKLQDLANAVDPSDPNSETRVFLGQPSPVTFIGNDPAALIPLIQHDPFELIAFLSAIYRDFTFAEVEGIIRDIFDEQYQLTITTESESDWDWQIVGFNPESGAPIWDYVEVGMTITNITLIVTPLLDILRERMTDEQLVVFEVYMWSMGLRQTIVSPFDFEWLPFVSSHFGFRVHPITGARDMHLGIDIAVPTGTPIHVGVTGRIIFAGVMGGYGNVVMIQSVDGVIELRYAHMHNISVAPGAEVTAGDIIGTVGSTGMSTGPHLHMEVILGGVHINPIFFVNNLVVNDWP